MNHIISGVRSLLFIAKIPASLLRIATDDSGRANAHLEGCVWSGSGTHVPLKDVAMLSYSTCSCSYASASKSPLLKIRCPSSSYTL
jgi:hypothetical protein